MLPPICTSLPALRRMCAISAVVVDLPLVPVMAMNGERGACLRRSRQNSSMSPITSTPACCASFTLQCGSGWVSGTPGASSSAETFDQSSERRSAGLDAGGGGLCKRRRAVVERDRRPRRRP